jgi:hypothetical protein
LLTAGLIGLAAAGFVRRWRGGVIDLPLALLAACPAFLLVANSYGGEMVFRVFLFSLPFLALFAARAFFPTLRAGRSTATAVVFGAVSLSLLAGTCLAYYGKERMTRFSHAEVTASGWLLDHAPENALILSATFDYPWAFRNYERYDYLAVALGPEKTARALLADPVTTATELIDDSPGGYFVVTRAQRAAIDQTGVLPAGSLARIGAALEATGSLEARARDPERPWFGVAYRNRDATIYQLVRP